MRNDAIEDSFMEQALDTLPQDVQVAYRAGKYTTKVGVRSGFIFLVWTLLDNKPVILRRVYVQGLEVIPRQGLATPLKVHSPDGTWLAQMYASHTPVQVYPGVFFSVPFSGDVLVTPKANSNIVRFCLLVKAPDAPDYPKEGKIAVSALSAFTAQFPGIL